MTWTRKDSNDRKVVEGILDLNTVKAIYKLQSKGVVDNLLGVVKEGKESAIIVAMDKEDRKIIIKVYKINASQFQKMQNYIVGDKRFDGIKLKRNSLVYAWCRKEFSNLNRSRKAGVRVPEPITFHKNLLVMEYIGDDDLAPKLKDIVLKNPSRMFDEIIEEVKKIYQKAGLVHADLSEYNILIHDNLPVIHDMAQSVELNHPFALEFLERDIKNLCRYFERKGVVRDKDKIIEEITRF